MDPVGGYAEVGRSYGKLVSDTAGAALGIANGIAYSARVKCPCGY